jgi:GNAT superfamily N-acetyltransferase
MADGDVTIRGAREEDAAAVGALAHSYALDKVDDQSASRDGFLIADYTSSDYATFAQEFDHFLVAFQAERLVGFVLADSGDDLFTDNGLVRCGPQDADMPVMYVKQVCVVRDAAGRGVAQLLYNQLFGSAPEPWGYCAIVAVPPNPRSEDFHRRQGFTPHGFSIGREGKPREHLERRPAGRTARERPFLVNVPGDPTQTHSALLSQLDVYSRLFRHEDDLTWGKVHRLILVTGILLAAYGVTIRRPGEASADLERLQAVGLGITFFGAVVCALFFFTISNGSLFISLRKQQFAAVERALARSGSLDLISRDRQHLLAIARSRGGLWRFVRTFPTPTALMFLPIAILLCWLALGGELLWRLLLE